MLSKSRPLVLLVLSVILTTLAVTVVSAALPSVRTFQPGLSAGVTVNGDASEWNTTVPISNPVEATFVNPDWAAFLCNEQGGTQNCDTGTVTGTQAHGPFGDLLLRFECPSTLGGNGTLYGLFIARPNDYILNETDGVNNWVKYSPGTTLPNGAPKLVSSASPAANWTYGTVVGSGWQYAEWSGTLAPDATPNQNKYTYSFSFHNDIISQGTPRTAGSGDTLNVQMVCGFSTAVTLSSFQAQSNMVTANEMTTLSVAAFIGLLTVASLLSIWRLRSRLA